MSDLHVNHIVIDCHDPAALAGFWAELLGVEVEMRWHQYVMLRATRDGAPGLAFQQVPEPKAGKNRVHTDFVVADLDGATGRAVGLGASELRRVTEDGVTVHVLADPEGNEFCLVRTTG